MKFRITLGLLALVAGLVFTFSALPGEAQAATAVTLSDADRSNLQSVLTLTKSTLDAVQVQIDRNAIRDRAGTIEALGNIRSYLWSINQLLSGGPLPNNVLIEQPEALAATPRVQQPRVAAPANPATPETPVVAAAPETPGEIAGAADEAPVQERQTASVSSSMASKRAFWIILVTAIIIAIILAIPRKKTAVVQNTYKSASPTPATPAASHTQQPQPQQHSPEPKRPEEAGPIQSA